MTIRYKCPRCGNRKTYVIRRSKHRCSQCKYEWQPGRLPLRFPVSLWRPLLVHFFSTKSVPEITRQTGLHQQRIYRALFHVRLAMATDIPPVFRGTVEVDETYLGGQWKNKRLSKRIGGTKRGRGTSKTPVFGILCRNGKVWAQVVQDTEAKTLQALILKRVRKGSTVCSDTWKSYTGIATKGYVHRIVKHGQGQYSNGKGTHINGLEGFWGYLKRKLADKGGIRRERLPLYLAEYVWRYNHRALTPDQKTDRILTLLRAKNT
jgi:transposase